MAALIDANTRLVFLASEYPTGTITAREWNDFSRGSRSMRYRRRRGVLRVLRDPEYPVRSTTTTIRG